MMRFWRGRGKRFSKRKTDHTFAVHHDHYLYFVFHSPNLGNLPNTAKLTQQRRGFRKNPDDATVEIATHAGKIRHQGNGPQS